MSLGLLTRATLAAYRLAGSTATPLVRRHLRRRAARGREDPARLGERFGIASRPRPPAPLVWVHAASVGESLSVLPLLERIRRDKPSLGLLVTTGTVTSARLMAERLPEGIVHQYAPVDLRPAIARFLDHWRPSLLLLVESELWPNLLLDARLRGCALVLINGRISPASFVSWRRARPIVADLLSQFDLILAQSPEDTAYFQGLGAAEAPYLGNLKFAAARLAAAPDDLARLKAALGDRPRWLAASTHPGEEAIAAAVHGALAPRFPGLITLIAPRHPDRGAEIARSLRAAGYRVTLRSTGEPLGQRCEIYVADTIGELGLWYRLSEIAWIGGSLVPKGGQNPLEAAKLDTAIVYGPSTENFLRVTEEMSAAGALMCVQDGDALAAAVGALLADDSARHSMAKAAAAYAEAQSGILDRVMDVLEPHLARAAEAAQ